MSAKNITIEGKTLSVLTDIKNLVDYQVKLLETMVANIDGMVKARNSFDFKQQMEAIQKIVPNNLDLEKIFNFTLKGKPVQNKKE